MKTTTVRNQDDYSWAKYLDCMEGGSDVFTLPEPAPAAIRWQGPLAGLSLAAGLALTAVLVGNLGFWTVPIEPVLLAIIFGMLLSNVWKVPAVFTPGIKFSVKRILPLGIVFLGARLNFLEVLRVGLTGIVLSVLGVVVALAFLLFLARIMNLPRKLGLLLGVGTAICGGTAIVAAAPVIKAEEKDVVFGVATVTLLGLFAMFLLPVLGTMMQLSETAFGIWAGLAIHQTPQVVAAGFAYGATAGDTATIVKLARVCLLAPVVIFIGWMYRRREPHEEVGRGGHYLHLFPMFVLGFLGMAVLRTLNLLPDIVFRNPALFGADEFHVSLVGLFETLSMYCIVISMAGVGLETRLGAVWRTGTRPFLAGLFGAVLIAALMLVVILGFGV